MNLWEWLLSIVWHGLDVFVHLWRIDREMREGKWDDDWGVSSRVRTRHERRARRLHRRRGTR
jgi:hypothetical protein